MVAAAAANSGWWLGCVNTNAAGNFRWLGRYCPVRLCPCPHMHDGCRRPPKTCPHDINSTLTQFIRSAGFSTELQLHRYPEDRGLAKPQIDRRRWNCCTALTSLEATMRRLLALLVSLVATSLDGLPGSLGAHALDPTTTLTSVDVCESRTINYITHTLPQQCLKTGWSVANATASNDEAAATSTGSAASANETQPAERERQEPAEEDVADSQDLATSSFMSFEEWKALQLKKAGQDPADLQARKKQDHKGDGYPSSSDGDLDSFGDDGEINLDFDALSEKVSEMTASANASPEAQAQGNVKAEQEAVLYDDGKTQYYRSKDAGKTCKERFSFASFDGGATILKTTKGVKNAKAIQVENKDSYMLFECRTENKFVIVELSDDILVDTVVLANFEFFSSMIRHFRVSVSDRYPVKMEKWKDLGTYEARNSRDIQPFLIEHPQIWAKYIRIEILSHYGNEFYCPLSLLRVHGTRMLDSWKESEAGQDDDEELAIEAPPVEQKSLSADMAAAAETLPIHLPPQEPIQIEPLAQIGTSPRQSAFFNDPLDDWCEPLSPTTQEPTQASSLLANEVSQLSDAGDDVVGRAPPSLVHVEGEKRVSEAGVVSTTSNLTSSLVPASAVNATSTESSVAAPSGNSSASLSDPVPSPVSSDISTKALPVETPPSKQQSAPKSAASNSPPRPPRPPTTTLIPKPSNLSNNSKNRTASSAQPVASPTVQESFFKTVTKRLQLLESNTSLSLQYIEDQSRFLQEALLKMERKQIARVHGFLDTLNNTVLSELRSVRNQYDQIWQSTVIALETQRDQSQREIVALSDRLSLLADEVVFQKRMAILQSALLLACLALVIFSRVGGVDLPSYASLAAAVSTSHLVPPVSPGTATTPTSPPVSPTPPRRRTVSYGSQPLLARAHSYPEKVLPLTPTSDYGSSNRSPTPPSLRVVNENGRLSYFEVDEREEHGEGSSDSAFTPSLERKRGVSPLAHGGPDGASDMTEDECVPFLEADDEMAGTLTNSSHLHGSTQSPELGIGGNEPPPARSSLVATQMGVTRKPLPALPEDPT
jgi:hypothetical protein